jgi:hypothetical protein
VKYSAAFQAKAADEMEARPQDTASATLISDYGKMRDACRSISR